MRGSRWDMDAWHSSVMLFSRRRRERALQEREQGGESLWTEHFDVETRTKLLYAIHDSVGTGHARLYFDWVRSTLVRSHGLPSLAGYGDPDADVKGFLLNAPDELVPDVIEAFAQAFSNDQLNFNAGNYHSSGTFVFRCNRVFREQRIAFDLVGVEMVPFESQELHVAVVVPALRLLASAGGLEKVEAAYQDALREISEGNAGDAITDVGTALQELLSALGCQGNQLGDQIRDAQGKGLFDSQDAKLLNWISAERSAAGDNHLVSSATVRDAWLAVHVVGAVIVHLAGQKS